MTKTYEYKVVTRAGYDRYILVIDGVEHDFSNLANLKRYAQIIGVKVKPAQTASRQGQVKE